METHDVVFNLDDTASGWQGDAVVGHVMKAPSAAHGGALTLLSAYFTNQAACNAGTAFSVILLNYGTTGTVNGGTVAAAIGGTADPFAAGTPKAFTLSSPKLAAGEWLVLRKNETNSSDPTRGALTIRYALGV